MQTKGLRKERGAPVTGMGKHFYQFYKGRENLFRIAIPFLRLGLESHEACLWIVSRSIGTLEAIDAFRRQCDLIRFMDDGQFLILPAERWYLEGGRFSQRKALKSMKQYFEERKRRGFSIFRVVGDVGWLEDSDWGKFLSYESKAHQWIQENPITAICAYPIERCSLAQTKEVVDQHDRVFLTKLC